VLNAPITIGNHRYMDGGVSGSTHFGAATGYPCVVGITPGGGPLAAREVQELDAGGSRVARVTPDADSAEARGVNLSDQSRAPGSAEAGLAQARSVVDALDGFWGAR
jgi:NTE family protein